jgi:antitoxin component of MazEF toxin-antitoxin module
MATSSRFSVDKRLMKLGGSLVVGVPNEVVEQWNLRKGDEVSITVDEGAIRIEPKQPTRVEDISEEMVAAYSKAVKGIQARVTLDEPASAIRLEFSGQNREAVKLLVYNLWRNLPVLLRLLGLGAVEETTKGERGKVKAREGAKCSHQS